MVMVSVTLPEVMSAADGVYTALTSVALLKVPVPEVVHVDEVALPPRLPASVKVVPEHMDASTPAFTVAPGLIVSNTASLTAGHIPAGLSVVKVKVIDPAEMSDAEGVYKGFKVVASSNVPVPLVVHNDDVALPPIIPDKVIVLPLQMIASVPAFVVAAGFIVNVNASLADGHGPAGSFVVIVNVTDPEVISAADGV